MTFTATYRDRTGAMREEAIEAASRSEAVASLKSMGIYELPLPDALRGYQATLDLGE